RMLRRSLSIVIPAFAGRTGAEESRIKVRLCKRRCRMDFCLRGNEGGLESRIKVRLHKRRCRIDSHPRGNDGG
ncbi:MAG: hypothetical protein OXC07_12955, partial [Kistimonas sp.]|nr:hypothetical protein [Kistimonas sp.]